MREGLVGRGGRWESTPSGQAQNHQKDEHHSHN